MLRCSTASVMESEPEFKNIDEAVKKLCVEAVKVEEELKEAEAAASLKKRGFIAAKQQNQELKGELGYLESQECKTNIDFKTSKEDIAYLMQKVEALTICLTDFQVEKKFLKNYSTNRKIIKETVVQRMKNWEISVNNEDGFTAEQKTLTDAQQKVTSLRYKRDALLSVPEKVSFLQRSLDDHLKKKGFLEKEVEMLEGYLMKEKQQVNHIRQEVLVYEQRNLDHTSRLRREIDEVSAHNSWLGLELSQLEGKVTHLRDRA